MPKQFRYAWHAPLYRSGEFHNVKFSVKQRKDSDIRVHEPCTIEEVFTRYDDKGRCDHRYKVRFIERRTVKPGIVKELNYTLPQLYVVKESAITPN